MPDNRIRRAYDRIELSAESSARILSALENTSPGEETNVKKMRKPLSVFVIAAILAVLMMGTAYAAFGRPAATGSHYMRGEGEYTSLEKLDKVEKIVGYPVTAVESFSNGYAFQSLHIGGEAVYDEDFNVLQEYYGVMIHYKKANAPDVTVNLTPVLEIEGGSEAPAPTEWREANGTAIRLSLDHYKLVPPDYEKTPEDEANIAAGHYYISYGSDEIEERDFVFAGFTLGEVKYVIMCDRAEEISFSDLAAMAGEIIAAAEK